MSTLNRFVPFLIITLAAVFTSSCELVGDIFEAGVWSGILLVVGGILLLIFLVAKVFGGRK